MLKEDYGAECKLVSLRFYILFLFSYFVFTC